MKKLLICVFITVTAFSASAQRNFKGGLTIGPVTSQMSGDGLGGWDKFGLAAGGFVTAQFNDHWMFNAMIKYVNKGSQKPADPNNGDNNVFIFRLNYIEVPLYASYKISNHLQLNCGPYVGLLTKQEGWSNALGTFELDAQFNPIDIGGLFGAQWWFNDHIGAEVRGTSSLLPARNAPTVPLPNSFYEKGNYHQLIELLFSYRF